MNNFENIIAIDTSGKICGVAIKTKNKKVIYNENTGYQHEEILFPQIINCLKKANIDIDDINKIVVSNGPGSYTGLRIGVACALGLSIKNNIKITYIDTLTHLSYNLKSKYDYILPIIDAKANRVYTALYDKNINKLSKEEIIDVDILIEIFSKYILNNNFPYKLCLIGDGVDVYNNKIEEFIKKNKIKNIIIADKKYRYNNVYNLCEMQSFEKQSDNIIINYMQLSQAEKKFKEG